MTAGAGLAHPATGPPEWASRDMPRPRAAGGPPPPPPGRRGGGGRPLGALGEELRLPPPPPRPPPGPRAADWLSNFAHFNKYLEKLFNSRWAGWGERAGGRTEGEIGRAHV